MKFDSLEKMRITYLEPKDYLVGSVKGLITYLGLKTNVSSKKYKNASYDITNVSMKDLSKVIRKFEKLPYKGYERKRPKHEPTDIYFYLARQIAKFMMRADFLNLHIDPVRMEMTGIQQIPISHICDLDESESKEFLTDKKLVQVCSTDESESESVIVDESSTEESE